MQNSLRYAYKQTLIDAPSYAEMPDMRQIRRKRLFDLVMATLVTMFLLTWLIPVISLAIVLTSPGPPLFIQLRSGRNGRNFYCLKFRTMYFKKQSDFQQTQRYDPRVTPLGRLLRRTNLDEIPQFLNVLTGAMSIVGPRPHAVQHDKLFQDKLPNYMVRYHVLPGITGLAQVRGNRGATDGLQQMEHRLKYDLFYIKKQSIRLDIQICWHTFLKMIANRTEAY